MAKICQYCGKGLSTKQWLDYHIARFHTMKPEGEQEEMSVSNTDLNDTNSAMMQVGGGKVKQDIFSEGDGSDSNDSDTDTESDMEEDEEEGDTSDDDNDNEEDPNWVFDFIIDQAKNKLDAKRAEDGVDYNLKDLRKRFRRAYASVLKWMHALRKNGTHKRVVSIAHNLRENSAGYDYNESIDAAVAKRKFLLDRLITEQDLDEEEYETETTL